MARDHDSEPTPIRASQSRADLDAAALADLHAEVARARRVAAWVVGVARWLGLPSLGALGAWIGLRQPEPLPESAPQHREQPASGPKPAECQPSADLIDAQERASRDARNAIDACDAMAAELKRQRKEESP